MRKQTRDNLKGRVRETRGRRLSLTPEVQAEILKAIEEGNSQKTACGCMGVPVDTYYSWLRRAEEAGGKAESMLNKSEAIYINFAQAIKKAIANGRRRNISIISRAAERDWHAAAWILERTDPEHYALRGRLDVNRNIEHNVSIKQDINVELSVANTGTVLDILAECGAIPPPAPGLERKNNEEE